MGAAISVPVLERDVGEDRPTQAVFIDVDSLVEPGLLGAETGLGVVRNVDEIRVGAVACVHFDGDVSDFNSRDGVCLRYSRFRLGGRNDARRICFCLLDRHLEHRSVEPGSAEVGNAVEVSASHHGKVLPEGVLGHLGSFQQGAERILLRLVVFRDGLFPRLVQVVF